MKNPVLQQVGYDELRQLSQCVLNQPILQAWTFSQIQSLLTKSNLQRQLHQEMHTYPIVSRTLQSLFSLSSLYQSNNNKPQLSKPQIYHFYPHGIISIAKQVIQPSWTLEFWLRIHQSNSTVVLFSSSNQVIQLHMETNPSQLSITTDNQTISFTISFSLELWNHFALEVDAITNVILLFHNNL